VTLEGLIGKHMHPLCLKRYTGDSGTKLGCHGDKLETGYSVTHIKTATTVYDNSTGCNRPALACSVCRYM